jgi:hypothetical protein
MGEKGGKGRREDQRRRKGERLRSYEARRRRRERGGRRREARGGRREEEGGEDIPGFLRKEQITFKPSQPRVHYPCLCVLSWKITSENLRISKKN